MTLMLSKNIQDELQQTARLLATNGKGILAADESMSTIGKKFVQIAVENTKENRRLYRQMLFGDDRIREFISGVILHDETLYQKDDNGKGFVDLLREKNIVPGIKVDRGLVLLMGTNNETNTQGLDDLKPRCEEYYKLGCRFAKWRAVLKIDEHGGSPSQLAIVENARGLARYASICQECRIVPIVEPEVLSDGNHSLEKCQQISQKVFAATIAALHEHNVLMEGILLKPNMITAGHDFNGKAENNAEEIGMATVMTLMRTIPPAVPGIMFLSGGQSEEEATVNLSMINQIGSKIKPQTPWKLSFSYGRALQNSAITIWAGNVENVGKAREELIRRMKANSLASQGRYMPGSSTTTSSTATKSNYVAKHVY
ncbi:fructose 1 [Dermatophagoides farinae]|uniref:Fructose-bisphosphate aldolase n=1 Tax=Dermatophagoides farinae TaxID=6954 RepID=A0A9D4SDI6_DERFA|nr:fructose-bisphosphate aldolase 2-like [Dermatophagoides farinae]KAH7637821.1 fructose 1 [Dermatophagoides farinae]